MQDSDKDEGHVHVYAPPSDNSGLEKESKETSDYRSSNVTRTSPQPTTAVVFNPDAPATSLAPPSDLRLELFGEAKAHWDAHHRQVFCQVRTVCLLRVPYAR